MLLSALGQGQAASAGPEAGSLALAAVLVAPLSAVVVLVYDWLGSLGVFLPRVHPLSRSLSS